MKIYLMDLKQVCEAIGFRKTAIYGWMRKVTFPRPVKIGRNVRWSSREGANKQVISSQADSLIKISRIWADFFPANTSNQPV